VTLHINFSLHSHLFFAEAYLLNLTTCSTVTGAGVVVLVTAAVKSST